MRTLRHSLGRLIENTASDERAAPEAVTTVNRFAAVDPPLPVLALDGTVLVRPAAQTNGQALAVIARDALHLVTGPHAQRIRVCATPECGFFFTDASHAGIRRWRVSCRAAAASARYRRSRPEVAQTS